jgi:hypothetical protein
MRVTGCKSAQLLTRCTTSLCLCLSLTTAIADNYAYYQPHDYGSDALYSPLGNFLSYSFDTLQLPDSFDTSDFRKHTNEVFDHLRHPRRAIENEGGFNAFVNRQIFPVDSANSNESYAALPNYALHLLGGGMVYRKDLEYFRAQKAEYPAVYATTLAMTAEILQEIFEKGTTTQDDEVADVYLFRPLGIWLFHQDAVADFVMRTLDPAIWPYLQAFDFSQDRLVNTGISYVYRPPATRFGDSRLFVFTGLNNLVGLSHSLSHTDSISWGIGLATQRIDFNLDRQAELETSFGIFYDRDKSLLWSINLNDAGGTNFRFNLFPSTGSTLSKLGYFLSHHENQRWALGLLYQLPLGIAFSSD